MYIQSGNGRHMICTYHMEEFVFDPELLLC